MGALEVFTPFVFFFSRENIRNIVRPSRLKGTSYSSIQFSLTNFSVDLLLSMFNFVFTYHKSSNYVEAGKNEILPNCSTWQNSNWIYHSTRSFQAYFLSSQKLPYFFEFELTLLNTTLMFLLHIRQQCF